MSDNQKNWERWIQLDRANFFTAGAVLFVLGLMGGAPIAATRWLMENGFLSWPWCISIWITSNAVVAIGALVMNRMAIAGLVQDNTCLRDDREKDKAKVHADGVREGIQQVRSETENKVSPEIIRLLSYLWNNGLLNEYDQSLKNQITATLASKSFMDLQLTMEGVCKKIISVSKEQEHFVIVYNKFLSTWKPEIPRIEYECT